MLAHSRSSVSSGRWLSIALTGILALAVTACGGRKEKYNYDQAPSADNGQGLSAKMTFFKQDDDTLYATLLLKNSGAPIRATSGGTGFRAFQLKAEGRIAVGTLNFEDGKGYYGYGGSNNGMMALGQQIQAMKSMTEGGLEIPPGENEYKIKWERLDLSTSDYPWTIVLTNLMVDGKQIADLSLPSPK